MEGFVLEHEKTIKGVSEKWLKPLNPENYYSEKIVKKSCAYITKPFEENRY
jgi:hypothetical protein